MILYHPEKCNAHNILKAQHEGYAVQRSGTRILSIFSHSHTHHSPLFDTVTILVPAIPCLAYIPVPYPLSVVSLQHQKETEQFSSSLSHHCCKVYRWESPLIVYNPQEDEAGNYARDRPPARHESDPNPDREDAQVCRCNRKAGSTSPMIHSYTSTGRYEHIPHSSRAVTNPEPSSSRNRRESRYCSVPPPRIGTSL